MRLELLKESHGRMQAAAATILSPTQLARLEVLLQREFQTQETEMRLNGGLPVKD